MPVSIRKVPAGRSLPYAAIPHHLAEDPRLTVLDIAVIRCLLRYARQSERCWVFVGVIAEAVRRGPRTVQLALRRLEQAGWIRSIPAENPSGREFELTWRVDTPAQSAAPTLAQTPALPLAQSPAPDSKTQDVEKDKPTGEDPVVVVSTELLESQLKAINDQTVQSALRPVLEAQLKKHPLDRVQEALRVTLEARRKGLIRTTLVGYLHGVLTNLAERGTLEPPLPAKASPQPSAEKTRQDQNQRTGEAALATSQLDCLREQWKALPIEAQEALRRKVRQSQPWVRNHPRMLDELCLSQLEVLDSNQVIHPVSSSPE